MTKFPFTFLVLFGLYNHMGRLVLQIFFQPAYLGDQLGKKFPERLKFKLGAGHIPRHSINREDFPPFNSPTANRLEV